MFEKCGRTTTDADGRRTPDHGYTISSPCEPEGSGELKRAITQKASYDFFKKFHQISTHHSLSANTGFKSLAFILFEILHLQNCDIKFQNFQRAITQKKSYDFF